MSLEYYSEIPVSSSEFNQTAQIAMYKAIKNAEKNDVLLTNAHLLAAIADTEWRWFLYGMDQAGLDPEVLRTEIDEFIEKRKKPVSSGLISLVSKQLVASEVKETLRRAKNMVVNISHGRPVEVQDIFLAICDEKGGIVDHLLNMHNLSKRRFEDRFLRLMISRDVVYKKKYDLPASLSPFATNLNMLAVEDKIPPLFGRDDELRQVMEILCHVERPNSVMLIGEPGVGKTAIVEGLARKIEFDNRELPVRLRDCQIVNLEMNAVIAGTNLRGDFENRIEKVIKEIKINPNLILFIDEAHTMIGAGSALNAPSDAANMFKSAMARGETRIIAATTIGEFNKYIEKDGALNRRFRLVHVDEPTLKETKEILIKVRPRMERNYSVRITSEAIDTAIEMSPRYVRNLKLPDKVIGWLDTASVRCELDGKEEVRIDDVLSVIAKVARIPKDMVSRDISERFELVEQILSRRVIGQHEAIRAVSERLRLNKGPLKDGFTRPDGVLLFLGPTGVGKTELAKALAEFLFGDEERMIRLDMSEYQNGQSSVEKLIGMPKGIVGSDAGGVLTSALKKNPYSVILLDEIEKADPRVLNVFLQAFGEGWLTDGQGKRVYLSDSIIIMTSNMGSDHFRKLTNPLGFREAGTNFKEVESNVRREAEKTFSPEFLNRIDEMIVFHPLSESEIIQITSKIINEIKETMSKYNKILDFENSVLEKIAKAGYSLAYGARFLKRKIEDIIKIPIDKKWKKGRLFRVLLKNEKIEIETENGEDG